MVDDNHATTPRVPTVLLGDRNITVASACRFNRPTGADTEGSPQPHSSRPQRRGADTGTKVTPTGHPDRTGHLNRPPRGPREEEARAAVGRAAQPEGADGKHRAVRDPRCWHRDPVLSDRGALRAALRGILGNTPVGPRPSL